MPDVIRGRDKPVFVASALIIVIAAIAAYWPGLSGPFVFDDFGSLSRLGDLGGVRDWPTFLAFVLGGDAGPTGRPLALLTFLLDGSTWPTDPWPFKRTNLIIHLLSGAALYAATVQIALRVTHDQSRAQWVALATTSIWLLHPFLVSTTLYSVQRMAQLSSLFCLAGIAVYLKGRRLLEKKVTLGYTLMSAALIGGTSLAILAKENGALLPLLIGVLEITVMAGSIRPAARLNKAWAAVFIVLPALFIGSYLLKCVFDVGLHTVDFTRGISMYERLLTEARVVADYLRHWFLPDPVTSGVFQDHFQPSTSLLSPLSTLLTALLHVSIVAMAIYWRKKQPLLAFAFLFFYAAHLIESTVINMELYFEHRNYLAAAFLALPITMAAANSLKPRFAGGLFLAITLLLASFTTYSSYVWRSYPSMVASAAETTPNSVRAQQQYALQLFNEGRGDDALERLDSALVLNPDTASLWLTDTIVRCRMDRSSDERFAHFANIVTKQPYDLRLLNSYELLFELVSADACQPIAMNELQAVFNAMLEVPVNNDPVQTRFFQIHYFLGKAALHQGRSNIAAEHFRESLKSRPTVSRAMLMASLMANATEYQEAMNFTDAALHYLSTIPDNPLDRSRVSREEIDEFRQRLIEAGANE